LISVPEKYEIRYALVGKRSKLEGAHRKGRDSNLRGLTRSDRSFDPMKNVPAIHQGIVIDDNYDAVIIDQET
jgi:hypothetical protein